MQFSFSKDILLWSASFTGCLISLSSVCVIFLKSFLWYPRITWCLPPNTFIVTPLFFILSFFEIRHYCSRWFDFYQSCNYNILSIIILSEFLYTYYAMSASSLKKPGILPLTPSYVLDYCLFRRMDAFDLTYWFLMPFFFLYGTLK